MFSKALYDYLDEHTLIGIKGGTSREKFTPIWMVRVGDRIFSRSWNKSQRSWFTEFLQSGAGQIQFGDHVAEVQGKKLDPADEIHKKIDQAYLEKYTQPANIPYAQGITQPEYADYTMEFILKEKD